MVIYGSLVTSPIGNVLMDMFGKRPAAFPKSTGVIIASKRRYANHYHSITLEFRYSLLNICITNFGFHKWRDAKLLLTFTQDKRGRFGSFPNAFT